MLLSTPNLVLLAAALAGAVMIVLGWRGRRVGEQPHCRRCGHAFLDLDAARATDACPECGRPTSAPRAIRIGARRRSPLLLVLGLALLLPLGLRVVDRARRFDRGDWQRLVPQRVLVEWELTRGDPAIVDGALREVVRRIDDGAFSDDDLRDLAANAIADRLAMCPRDPFAPLAAGCPLWNPLWGDVIVRARGRELVGDDDFTEFVLSAARIDAMIVPARRSRHEIPLAWTVRVHGDRLMSNWEPTLRESDGGRFVLEARARVAPSDPPASGASAFESTHPLDLSSHARGGVLQALSAPLDPDALRGDAVDVAIEVEWRLRRLDRPSPLEPVLQMPTWPEDAGGIDGADGTDGTDDAIRRGRSVLHASIAALDAADVDLDAVREAFTFGLRAKTGRMSLGTLRLSFHRGDRRVDGRVTTASRVIDAAGTTRVHPGTIIPGTPGLSPTWSFADLDPEPAVRDDTRAILHVDGLIVNDVDVTGHDGRVWIRGGAIETTVPVPIPPADRLRRSAP